MKPLVALALLGSCIVTPVIHFGASPKEQERARLAELLPPQLDMTRRWGGPMSTARIRVWADADYRSQNLRWRETFGEQLDYANAVLEPTFGVHLVADYREWEYRAPAGSPLQDTLEVLAQHDPGTDVLSVVGLVSSLSLVSATFDELGLAESPGNHVVLRGYADLAERAIFERAFPKLSADERNAALEARRRHKTTAVFLHEVVHNLGVPHDPEPDTIMSAIYSDHETSFSESSLQLAFVGLDQRLHRSAYAPARAPAPVGNAPPVLPAPRELQHVTLTVQVAADGSLRMGSDAIDATAFDDRLRAAVANAETELAVQVAKQSPRDVVVRVIDRAKALGVRRVTLVLVP